MTQHDPIVRLQHMRDHAGEAIEMAAGRTREDLDADRMLNLALTRLLEIIGEAAARVPDSEHPRYPTIPWPQIVGLRNRLIHGYDEVNFEILWSIVQNDLPPLCAELERILADENQHCESDEESGSV